MITVTAQACVIITVTCDHGSTEVRLLPPDGLDAEGRREVLDRAKELAVERHRSEPPTCDCPVGPDIRRDWLN